MPVVQADLQFGSLTVKTVILSGFINRTRLLNLNSILLNLLLVN